MKHLCKTSAEIFFRIISLGQSKIVNNENYMPLSVECIQETFYGKVYSLAHYYEQNGDLMRDPEMTFLVAKDMVFPLSYRQDGLGIDRESVFFENGKPTKYIKRMQSDQTSFANGWMRNIAEQQKV